MAQVHLNRRRRELAGIADREGEGENDCAEGDHCLWKVSTSLMRNEAVWLEENLEEICVRKSQLGHLWSNMDLFYRKRLEEYPSKVGDSRVFHWGVGSSPPKRSGDNE